MSKIVLYDIPSRGRASCLSHNVWKTRLVLNYKKIPYETVWLEHQDVGSTLESISAPPTISPTGQEVYTVPTIVPPGGEVVSDSLRIAQHAEQAHPDPSLDLENSPHALAAQKVATATLPLMPVFIPRLPRTRLCESSVAFFEATRSARFGMPLDEFEATRGGEAAWEAARPGLDALNAFMGEHKVDEGPFVLGSRVSYADFVVMAVLEGFRRIGEDIFEKVVEGRQALKEVWQSCREWTEKDD